MSRAGIRRSAAVALVAGALAMAVAWGWARRESAARAQRLYQAVGELAACTLGGSGLTGDTDAMHAALRRRISLARRSERPLEPCDGERRRALSAHAALRRLPTQRATAAQRDALADALSGLADADLHADAWSLARGVGEPASRLADAVASAIAASCAVAVAEGALGAEPCPIPAGRPPLAVRSRVLHQWNGDAGAWAATTRGGTLAATVASGSHRWYVEVRGDGVTAARLAPAANAADDPPAVLFVGRRSVGLLAGGAVYSLASGRPALVGTAPADDLPVGAGAVVLTLGADGSMRSLATVVTAGGATPGRRLRVTHLEPAAVAERELPPGEPVALFHDGEPRLAVVEQRADGFAHVLRFTVPAAGEPWPAGVDAPVSWVTELQVPRGAERRCGIPSEETLTFLARGPADAVLVALGETETWPFRFGVDADERVDVLCGACAVGVLSASPRGLRMHLPVRRKLLASDIDVAASFDDESATTASASCTPRGFVVAYVAAGRVLVQRSDPSGWRFRSPVEVATADQEGSPREVALLAEGATLHVLWRRSDGQRSRLELASSPDGGTTFP